MWDIFGGKKKHTDISVLECDLIIADNAVDRRNNLIVEILRAGRKSLVLCAVKVRIRARLRILATRCILQPPGVFRPSAGFNRVDRDELVSVERSLDVLAVCERRNSLHRGIQALEEAHGGVLEYIVDGGLDLELG